MFLDLDPFSDQLVRFEAEIDWLLRRQIPSSAELGEAASGLQAVSIGLEELRVAQDEFLTRYRRGRLLLHQHDQPGVIATVVQQRQ